MYDLLSDIAHRPKPFSSYTAKELWTRPHLAQQMLSYHLDPETELASRRLDVIDHVVDWIDGKLDLSGKKLCDLGCGPGLYTQRFTDRGAKVTGVDFSAHSLDYARAQGYEQIRYIHADYLLDDLPMGFDVITLIYMDLCALSPDQRSLLLGRMRKMLNTNGKLVLDVAGMGAFANQEELTIIEHGLMNGFWAASDYVGIQRTFVYPEEHVSLDRYAIIEPDETWQILNWMQYFTADAIERELKEAGFQVDLMVGGLSGEPLKSGSETIGVIASLN